MRLRLASSTDGGHRLLTHAQVSEIAGHIHAAHPMGMPFGVANPHSSFVPTVGQRAWTWHLWGTVSLRVTVVEI